MRNPFLLSLLRALWWLLAEAGQARDVAGDAAAETRFMVICLAVRSGWCRRSRSPWTRLPSDRVSGPHTNGGIARLRGER